MLTQVQKEIQQGISECASVEAELEDEKSGIIDIVRRTAQLHNELQSLSDYRDNLSNQRQRLSGRADTAKQELEQLVTEKAQYQVRLGDIEKNLNEINFFQNSFSPLRSFTFFKYLSKVETTRKGRSSLFSRETLYTVPNLYHHYRMDCFPLSAPDCQEARVYLALLLPIHETCSPES